MEIFIVAILIVAFIVMLGRDFGMLGADFNPYNDDNFKLGVYKTIIKGTQYRWLFPWDMGVFHGKAVAQTNNPHDKYAVAIYNGIGKHIGFAPRGYMTLHQSILDRGGSVYCCGLLRSGDYNKSVILGDVYIDFDPNYWEIKRRESGIKNIYKSPNLKRYTFDVSNNYKVFGKFYGEAHVVGDDDESRHVVITNGEEPIGMLHAIDETVYNSIEEFHNGKTVAWGYTVKDKNQHTGKTKVYGFVYIPIKCSQNKIDKELLAFKQTD